MVKNFNLLPETNTLSDKFVNSGSFVYTVASRHFDDFKARFS